MLCVLVLKSSSHPPPQTELEQLRASLEDGREQLAALDEQLAAARAQTAEAEAVAAALAEMVKDASYVAFNPAVRIC